MGGIANFSEEFNGIDGGEITQASVRNPSPNVILCEDVEDARSSRELIPVP